MSTKQNEKVKVRNEALVEVDPMTELSQLRANFDRMLGGMLRGHWEEAWNAGWGCDVKDDDAEIVVRAEAPGFEPDEIDVQISGNRLVLQAEHQSHAEDGDKKTTRHGKLYRAVALPNGIDEEHVSANYRNGVLEVHLPKSDAVKPKRIAVTAS
ncbi:Hsp20/alpha crystallin family protein [Aporhodopirellula aestuarii]|uniref:Hsp20/alpha crystallin family protein n=1 Tax=Aporhodopirellula aestuarii TaxID=2950107 RepID=A0ABT0U038_9BACT|nr:Hsp20/alpha crystallin family protein [Aporhodopirellula aestuarii]MCM2370190.1 Hsp20/alpha crystallin family protein [Aporhodopirellula aestuarii]